LADIDRHHTNVSRVMEAHAALKDRVKDPSQPSNNLLEEIDYINSEVRCFTYQLGHLVSSPPCSLPGGNVTCLDDQLV